MNISAIAPLVILAPLTLLPSHPGPWDMAMRVVLTLIATAFTVGAVKFSAVSK